MRKIILKRLLRQHLFSRYSKFRSAALLQQRKDNVALAMSGNKKELKRVQECAEKDWDNYEFLFKTQYPSKADFISTILSEYKAGKAGTVLKYIKPSTKQGFDEKTQFNYIKKEFSEILAGKGTYTLVPKSSHMYYVNNKIVYDTKDNIQKIYKSSAKSIDLKIDYSLLGKNFLGLGTLKHTDDFGGSQTNQFNDIENTNKEFVRSVDKNLYTFSIISGTHYTDKKYKYLISTYKTERNFITSVDKFGYILCKAIKSWITNVFSSSELQTKEIVQEVQRLEILSIKYRLNMSRYNENN